MITTGSDFSGVGALDQALDRLGIEQNKVLRASCNIIKNNKQRYFFIYVNFRINDGGYPSNVVYFWKQVIKTIKIINNE